MEILLILIFSSLGSFCSVGLAGTLLLLKRERLYRITGRIIPYAIGTLLGASFFGMIPHALTRAPSSSVLPAILLGIILFYVLEKCALWRHCHKQPCDVHTRAGNIILIGDSLHNFVDGVAIALAFSGSVPLGIVTSIAVIAHEVPQEVGDFAILLESGYSPARALCYNTFSSLAAVLGAVLTYFLLPFIQALIAYMLSLSAASFIYIALADLVPGRRATGGLKSLAWELPLILLGIATIVVLRIS